MKPTLIAAGLALALISSNVDAAKAPAAKKTELGTFGIDLSNQDKSVKPGNDFNRYANGHWLDTYQLRDYDSRYGSFNELSDRSELQARTIIESLQADKNIAAGSEAQKIRDYYASYMNLDARNAAGIAPLKPVLDQIAAIDTPEELAAQFGAAGVNGTQSPVGIGLGADRKDPNKYQVSIGVGGLGLPDKDYYVNTDPRFVKIRAAYVEHIATMLGFTGVQDAKSRAEAIMALETALAKPQWDRADRRDRDKTYNLTQWSDVAGKYGKYDWATHLKALGMPVPTEVNDTTPSAVAPILDLIAQTPLATWRDYLTFNAVRNNAAFLSKDIDDANFAFTGTVLSGTKTQRESWKRAVTTVGGSGGLGDAVGKIYVAQHFKPEAKVAMDSLVENLRKALRLNIEQIDWMGATTKAEAYHKLETFRPKIGYTVKWRDYGDVAIVPDNLMANVIAMRRYYNADQNRRIGTVPDRDEWGMTPQTVNAYYNSSFNEVVFPAGILQPPFFDVNADAAVNYGGIGAVIGHEMGHGFDDQGSKSDFAGIQRLWWTPEDRALFDKRVAMLGAQYDGYCPFPNQCVNGKLTMGENIGDLGGLSMAYTAYHLSLNGKPAPVIDGLTGDQRFFLAWAQVWRAKYRDEATINQIKSDPHSPPAYRINGPIRNLDAWYAAFNVKPGDALYLPPEQRVRIW